MSEIPKRPTHRDEYVCQRSAELALPALLGWEKRFDSQMTEATKQEILEQAAKAFSCCSLDDDGYEQARVFEREGWSSDSQLVDILESDYPRQALKELTAQWVKAYSVTIPFAIGDKVMSKRLYQRADEVGTVIRMDSTQAMITVHYEDMAPTAGYVLELEHVTAAPMALVQSAG